MAGLLDFLGQDGGGLLGNLGQNLGRGIADNQNAIMAMGLGLASGQNWADGLGNAFRGFMVGSERDKDRRGQLAAVEYVLGRPDVDPALKEAIRRNPQIAAKFLGEAGKPPKYDTHNYDGNIVQTRPDQPGISPVARIPGMREVDDGAGGKKLVEITPSLPIPHQRQPNIGSPTPGQYQGNPQGFQDRFSGAGAQPTPGQMQPNRVQTVYEPPPPTNPEAMPGKPTDEQNKAAGFAKRMFNAEATFQNQKVVEAATTLSNRQRADIPVVGNYLVSKEFQKFDQASRDFINALLRRESGAVIQPSEFTDARKQYLPTPGDDPETLAQKRTNRQTSIRAMSGSAGPTFKGPLKFDADGNVVPAEVSQPINSPGAPQPKGEQGRAPAVRVQSMEQARQLPRGTRFIAPDGQERYVP